MNERLENKGSPCELDDMVYEKEYVGGLQDCATQVQRQTHTLANRCHGNSNGEQ